MVKEPDDSVDVVELEIDDVNTAHVAEHKVNIFEVLEVLANRPQFFHNLDGRGASHVMLGPNFQGRFLYIAIRPTATPGLWRPLTAFYYSRRRALRYYQEESDDD